MEAFSRRKVIGSLVAGGGGLALMSLLDSAGPKCMRCAEIVGQTLGEAQRLAPLQPGTNRSHSVSIQLS